MPKYIIEHLEPKMWKWCLFEYERMSKIVGKKNLWFTNIKKPSKSLERYGKVIRSSVSKLNLKDAVILDMESPSLLTPKEAKKYKYFIFGGILGDYPPRKRTKAEITSKIKNAISFNIGKKQFSTDTAVYVVNKIVNGENLKSLPFIDKPRIKINEIEEIILPFRYIKEGSRPLMSEKVLRYLKNKKDF